MTTNRPKPVQVYDPTPEHHRAATLLAESLRRVSFPERGWNTSRSVLPPGRLDTNQAIQRRVQRLNGEMPTAKPFVQRKREPIVKTTLTTGFMFDGSASQWAVQEAVSVSRWVATEAISRVHGKVAAVQFGATGRPVQAPSDRLRKIEVYSADDGWENYIQGFSLIDSALNLIDGSGARLLFIVTDGQFNDQAAIEYAEVTMDMCRRNGVAVVWVDAGRGFARPDAYGHGSIVSIGGMSPVEVATLFGRIIIEEFKRAAPQHSLLSA